MHSSIGFSIITLLAVTTAFAQTESFTQTQQQAQFDTSIVPLRMPTVGKFIDWASRSDRSGRKKVKDEILRHRDSSTMLPGIFEKLFAYFDSTRYKDLGRSLITLGIIGELKQPFAMRRLYSLVTEPLPERQKVRHGALTQRDAVEMLQAKAVEALAYLQTRTADSLVIKVIQNHPSSAVRDAAISAYLFNHGDSAAVKKRLRLIVRHDDLAAIDVARFNNATSSKEFAQRLRVFYARHPEAGGPRSRDSGDDNISTGLWGKMFIWLFGALLAILVGIIVLMYFLRKKH